MGGPWPKPRVVVLPPMRRLVDIAMQQRGLTWHDAVLEYKLRRLAYIVRNAKLFNDSDEESD